MFFLPFVSSRTPAGYVLDKDGTLVRQSRPVDGAREFVSSLQSQKIPFVILSNTGEKTSTQVAHDLGQVLGLALEPTHVHTAHDQLADALETHVGGAEDDTQVYVVGRTTAPQAAHWRRLEEADPPSSKAVVAVFSDGMLDDFCATVTRVVALIECGASLWVTSADASLTDASGQKRPGPGVFVDAVEATLGRPLGAQCRIFGKGGGHDADFGDVAMKLLRAQGFQGSRRRVMMVGDRFDTDVRTGGINGWSTCLVESGCHTAEEHAALFPRDMADVVADSVRDLVHTSPTGTLRDLVADLMREVLRRVPPSCDLAQWVSHRVEAAAARVEEVGRMPPRRIRSLPNNLCDL